MPKTNIHAVTPIFSFMKPNRSHGKYVPQQKKSSFKIVLPIVKFKNKSTMGL